MTNDRMSNDEINRTIAEFLEPKPIGSQVEGSISSGKVWLYVYHREGCEGCGWIPRDFCTDPELTVRLMKHFIDEEYHFTFWPQSDGSVIAHFSDSVSDMIEVRGELNMLFPLAFIKAKGLGK